VAATFAISAATAHTTVRHLSGDYLQAALDQIAHDHGDIPGFLRNEIGLDDGMRLKMHAALLSRE
jgi:hypothetical protein